MKKSLTILYVLSSIFLAAGPVMAQNTGGIDVGFPPFAVGYTNQSWQFATFEASPALFNISLNHLKSADRTSAVVGNILNGNVPSTRTDVTGKSLAVLNHIEGFRIYPNTASSPFPSIWVKGGASNPESSVHFTGTDSDKFFQQGLTIQAPYYATAEYPWTVYVFADKDILTQTDGTVSGKVLDPRVATMRWFAWADDSETEISAGTFYGSRGIAKSAFGYRSPGQASPNMFNIMPVISNSASISEKKAFLTGTSGASLPELYPSYSQEVGGMSQASFPADGQIYYNTDRNTQSIANANNMVINGRSQIGLVYAAPSGPMSRMTRRLHIQFIVLWPDAPIGVSAGQKSCDINIYQRTTP
jgi:hypothetical protein